ncbi:MAG: DUF3604 domain-containing protein [Simkaniaceae bacterium]|nr:DUF3604 domain-containing protein [Simkaniaceae bacterium]
MRRSICFAEPKGVMAGAIQSWKFVYSPSNNLPGGTFLLFDFLSKGRDIDWEAPTSSLKAKTNNLLLELPTGAMIAGEENLDLTSYKFVLPSEIKAGDSLTFHLIENRAQTTTQRRRPFYLHIDPKGKGEYRDSEIFTVDIRGGELSSIRILVPSIVMKNQRFDVSVRFEDAYGNLTGHTQPNTLIELSYDQLRDNISWKLFIPETGFIILPNLYFNDVGIYRIKLTNLADQTTFFSPPIKCFADAHKEAFWGLFHGEFELFDTAENVESALRHARDVEAIQFFASSSFDKEQETPAEVWKQVASQIAEFNEEDRFITFLGQQWVGEPGTEGVRQFVYTKDAKPLLRNSESKANNLKKIYKSHSPKDFISIPSFTMGKGAHYSFDDYTPEYEPVVEIYNAWGSSECTLKEGNLKPIVGKKKGTFQEFAKGSLRSALNRGCRFGFVAGGFDDRDIYQELFESDQEQYTAGLTAVLSFSQSREAILAALFERSTFCTTGSRMVLGIYVAKQPIGSILNTEDKPGLAFNRHLSGYVVGEGPLKTIEIFRNGELYKTLDPQGLNHLEFALDDEEPIEKAVIKGDLTPHPFVYYYLRAQEENGHVGWTSPIWIDHTASLTNKKRK